MSGGTPVTPLRGKFMRQRHSQGYGSGSEDIDLEDDASSRPSTPSPSIPRPRTWVEVMENVLWIASAFFIVYYGDQHSNLIYLLWHDGRIRRTPLYLGMVGVGLELLLVLYTRMLDLGVRNEKWEMSCISTLPFVMLLGVVSFCLLSCALWPIWKFLTLPLLFTLLMATLVLSPYATLGRFRPQTDALRID